MRYDTTRAINMNDDFDVDMDEGADIRIELSMEDRLDSIQQLIHELSYSIRAQRDQITMISDRARENAALFR